MKRPRFTTAAFFWGLGFALLAHPFPLVMDGAEPPESRKSLIARSRVWFPTDVPLMNLRTGPAGPGSFEPGATVTCEYVDKKLGGVSPKFACRLPDGDEVKVKYGGANGEVYGEVAASRLFWALGFGADRMYSVRVICRGCHEEVGGILRSNGDRIVDPAAVERKMPGEELFDKWGWDELDQINESAGGASKAERDALKLLAVLLQHSVSKAKQRRLICVEGSKRADGHYDVPMMMINDLGVTFGRANALNQQPPRQRQSCEWTKLPIWKDSGPCVGNLSASFKGTLKNPIISGEGREFLADLLVQLSDQQLREMFEAARVHLRPARARQRPFRFPDRRRVGERVQAETS